MPWCRESLWLVPVESDADSLGGEDVSRGRIWTVKELIALMALPDRRPATVQSLTLAKRAVDGDIVDVRRDDSPTS